MYVLLHTLYVCSTPSVSVGVWMDVLEFACLGCCKQCPGKKWGAPVFLKDDFSLDVRLGVGVPDHRHSCFSPWSHICSFCCCCLFIVAVSTFLGRRRWHPLQCSCLGIPWTEEPGGLPSMGSHRVGHDWRDLAAAAALYFPQKQCGKLPFPPGTLQHLLIVDFMLTALRWYLLIDLQFFKY